MTTSDGHSTASPPIYPAYLHPLSPTFSQWARLTAADFHQLQAHRGFVEQGIYHYSNHPIRFVRIVGPLVAVTDYERRWVLTVDDSSGSTLDVVVDRPEKPKTQTQPGSEDVMLPEELAKQEAAAKEELRKSDLVLRLNLDVGSVVKVKGTIGEFRGTKQLLCKRLTLVADTNAEVQAWQELTTFRTSVLAKRWYVSPEEQARMLEETLKERRRAEERERRRKEKEERAKRREASGKHTRHRKQEKDRKSRSDADRRKKSAQPTPDPVMPREKGLWDDEIEERRELLESLRAKKRDKPRKERNSR